jgi:hypothetical protein
MSVVVGVRWSAAVEEAAWIAERLDRWARADAGMVVPRGFDAYVRLLHPGETTDTESRMVRWAEVAVWSGLEMRPGSSLEDVALPLDDRGSPRPWRSPPRRGSLAKADLAALVDVLGRHTDPTGDCLFCIWDGYGWNHKVPLTRRRWGRAPNSKPLPDPIPKHVRDGPRVELPNRSYLLYQGPLDHAMAWIDSEHQSPNLWWPQDRAWCVATGIDLPWTYVGGPEDLAAKLLSEVRVEAQPATPDDPLRPADDRLMAVATGAAQELVAGREATVVTGVGTLRMWLGESPRIGPNAFNHQVIRNGGGGSGSSRISEHPSEDELASLVMIALCRLTSN